MAKETGVKDTEPQRANTSAEVLKAVQRQAGDLPELAEALVAAWGEIGHVEKDSTNPHLGNDYASLKSCLNTVKPVFRTHGLALVQAPGEMNSESLSLEALLLHKSGQSIRFRTQLPVSPQLDKKTGEKKLTAQAAGSAITYARRYQLMAVAGMAPTDAEDDDGTAASDAGAPVKERAAGVAAGRAILAEIKNAVDAKDMAALTLLREQVKASGEQVVADAYIAAREAIKGQS